MKLIYSYHWTISPWTNVVSCSPASHILGCHRLLITANYIDCYAIQPWWPSKLHWLLYNPTLVAQQTTLTVIQSNPGGPANYIDCYTIQPWWPSKLHWLLYNPTLVAQQITLTVIQSNPGGPANYIDCYTIQPWWPSKLHWLLYNPTLVAQQTTSTIMQSNPGVPANYIDCYAIQRWWPSKLYWLLYNPTLVAWSPMHSHYPGSKVHGANMGPTWVLSAPDGPHVCPMDLAIRVGLCKETVSESTKRMGEKLIWEFVFKMYDDYDKNFIIHQWKLHHHDQFLIIIVLSFQYWQNLQCLFWRILIINSTIYSWLLHFVHRIYLLMFGNLYIFFESSLSFFPDAIIANHSLVIIVMVLHWIDNNTPRRYFFKNTVWNGDNFFYKCWMLELYADKL